MSNAARNHKDNVFCLLYRDKKNLLSLYNAMNGTAYEKEEELEVVTLEEAICMKMRNDAAFWRISLRIFSENTGRRS